MTDRFTPVMRALVAASLLLATATLMLVAVNTARAAGALAIGACGAFGEAYDFGTIDRARKARAVLAKLPGGDDHACCRYRVDFTNACDAKAGQGRGSAQPEQALRLLPVGGKDVYPHVLATPRADSFCSLNND